MAREGLMDDTGYHGFDIDCPEKPNKDECSCCLYWNETDKCDFEEG